MQFLADRCNATFGYCHEMSTVCLSSVTRVYCGQMVSWIRMPLGMEVGLGPSDFVLDGDPVPPTQSSTAALPNFFGPCLLWPNGCMDQDATWYADRPGPKWHCIRWGPSSTHPKGHSSPPQFFSAHVYCGQTAAWIRMPHGMQIGRCWIEAIFSACHTNPNPMHWSLAFVIWANRWA